ncbi:hypothetical protein A2773_02615 [Candidatus Gottesmanbacteria bacterium RIFCSPHIGHO2_01_FULL_39_10]|uniref:Hexokinase C-terminal domain-containing protein n=1 Tax=Candidatus Gottesmanbacteria bacterium RIFCSPHIGHO2_01_FULL_39_10 TaxID=1798375 RepID=A0A1F5ZQP5_9BACT|nr:MAG: hypothetical protein A2773_02615 [Candidatus Gottesmanbacteria bacterium RIFCSPHIGHO2_01_FULL_39_10]
MTPKSGFGVAVAVGGTNGYVSAFYLKDTSEIKFMSRQIFTIPKKTTQTDLFHLITKNILFVTKNRKEPFPIGIGLAYPLKPLLTGNFIDGELLYMTKDRIIEGLVGKRVGQEYHKFLKKEYGIDTTVAVANDAICLLLGGGKVEIAGVVGTGLNFAYWDRRSQVAPLKLSQLAGFVQNEVAVNIESKNFDKIKGTKYRDVLDKASSDPGYSLSEKEVAGAYLYKLFNSARKDLIKEKFPDLESTDELNDILTHAFPYPKSLSKVSKTNIRLLANRIFHKSAQIVAIQLCGICQKIGKTEGLVPVVMEGGIFWKAKNYPALVNLYVNMILPKTLPSFARLFGSSRRGIAILAKTIY